MDNPFLMMGAVVFGSIGMGYFIYGKKQQRWGTLVSGIALMAYPYFVASVWLQLLIGALLVAAPMMLKV